LLLVENCAHQGQNKVKLVVRTGCFLSSWVGSVLKDDEEASPIPPLYLPPINMVLNKEAALDAKESAKGRPQEQKCPYIQ
jgi:hypothetical protein